MRKAVAGTRVVAALTAIVVTVTKGVLLSGPGGLSR